MSVSEAGPLWRGIEDRPAQSIPISSVQAVGRQGMASWVAEGQGNMVTSGPRLHLMHLTQAPGVDLG